MLYPQLARFAKRWTPARLRPFARRLYDGLFVPCVLWAITATDTVFRRTYYGRTLPPALLRFKVRGTPSGKSFVEIGKRCRDGIVAALNACGRDPNDFRSILDFGCGSGGTLIWLEEVAPKAALRGTDVDADAIAWCRGNLTYAEFDTNDPLPPLRYRDASFDLVYAVSVFTHLDEQFQHEWLRELRRITAPGGCCVVTVHAPDTWPTMPVMQRTELESKGHLFVEAAHDDGLFPRWYQTAFHTKRYVEETFGRYFRIVGYFEKGLANDQDVVVMQ